jgi:phage-related protein
MKTLTTPVTDAAAASQAGWCELYDIFLPINLVVPWSDEPTNVLRLTDRPSGLSFFAPLFEPEQSFVQGTGQFYAFWPLKREAIRADAKTASDRLVVAASNVTGEFLTLLDAVEWRGCPIVIRKVPFTAATLTADDSLVLYSGNIDTARVTNEQIALRCSNDLGNLSVLLPRHNMHATCRFKFGDDFCTALKFSAENWSRKTVGVGSTTTLVKSAGFTEDGGANGSYGTDQVAALLDAKITTSSQQVGFEGYRVKAGAGATDLWRFSNTASPLDWGVNTQGYWQIPDAQAGLQEAALKPYIQFDFSVNVALKLWRVRSGTGLERELLPRLILFFSSTDASTWKFETYFEMPPMGAVYYDVPIPKATSGRYWRICVRTRWAETIRYSLFEKVQAYFNARNWWADGLITFTGNVTAALTGVVVPVLESYSGEVVVGELPAAPAAGDTFLIQRGCSRTFNGCAGRLNTENFGGFDSMPVETIIR